LDPVNVSIEFEIVHDTHVMRFCYKRDPLGARPLGKAVCLHGESVSDGKPLKPVNSAQKRINTSESDGFGEAVL
jgi:hypothetical protein